MLQTIMVAGPESTYQQLFSDAPLLALLGRGEDWALSEIHACYARFFFSIARKTLHDPARDRPALPRLAWYGQDALASRPAQLEIALVSSRSIQ